MSGCTVSSVKWAGRAPAGTVLLRIFIGSSGERVVAGPNEGIVAAAMRDVATTMAVRGEPILTRVGRWVGAMPHYTVGHLDRVAAVSAALESMPGVFLAGSAYRGVSMPDCIAPGARGRGPGFGTPRRGLTRGFRAYLRPGTWARLRASDGPWPRPSPRRPSRIPRTW